MDLSASFLLTLFGGCAALVAAWGLTLVLDKGGWRDRLFGFLIVILFGAIGVSFWSWAAFGSPWEFWRIPLWGSKHG